MGWGVLRGAGNGGVSIFERGLGVGGEGQIVRCEVKRFAAHSNEINGWLAIPIYCKIAIFFFNPPSPEKLYTWRSCTGGTSLTG